MGEYYNYDVPLHNAEPLILKKKVEINMVTTHAKSAEQSRSVDSETARPTNNGMGYFQNIG